MVVSQAGGQVDHRLEGQGEATLADGRAQGSGPGQGAFDRAVHRLRKRGGRAFLQALAQEVVEGVADGPQAARGHGAVHRHHMGLGGNIGRAGQARGQILGTFVPGHDQGVAFGRDLGGHAAGVGFGAHRASHPAFQGAGLGCRQTAHQRVEAGEVDHGQFKLQAGGAGGLEQALGDVLKILAGAQTQIVQGCGGRRGAGHRHRNPSLIIRQGTQVEVHIARRFAGQADRYRAATPAVVQSQKDRLHQGSILGGEQIGPVAAHDHVLALAQNLLGRAEHQGHAPVFDLKQ